MSRENVELIRRGYALFNAGETDAWLALFDRDIELRVSGVFPGFDPLYRGHDGLTRFREILLEAWESFEAEPKEIVDRGEYVGVVLQLQAKGRGSGAEVDLTFHHAFRFRDGLIDRWASYPTLDQALEAAGLSE